MAIPTREASGEIEASAATTDTKRGSGQLCHRLKYRSLMLRMRCERRRARRRQTSTRCCDRVTRLSSSTRISRSRMASAAHLVSVAAFVALPRSQYAVALVLHRVPHCNHRTTVSLVSGVVPHRCGSVGGQRRLERDGA